MKIVNVLITDLDDTIWDWQTMWYNSFHPYLERISRECAVDRQTLIQDFKKLHSKYHTSEVSYAYKELEHLSDKYHQTIDNQTGNSILHEYNRNKKHNLRLYENVRETLEYIKSQGTRIIGFTESNIFYTKYRIKTLQLDGLFDTIYTTEDHVLPKDVVRHNPEGSWDTHITQFRILPEGFKKPNPEILNRILEENNVKVNDAIYIGDKLDRDILMASEIHLVSVHAAYGYKIDNVQYELLREVTHWSKDEVEREKKFKKSISGKKIKPTYTISDFKELLDIFKFDDYRNAFVDDFDITDDAIKNKIEIWKNCVDVQKHFNDLQIRIRNYAITLFTFVFAGIGYCLKDNIFFHYHNISFSLSTLLAFIGLLVITAIAFMDIFMYHRLLQASVSQGMSIEKSLSEIYPEISLSSKIKEKSPIRSLFGIKIHSGTKLRFFYIFLWLPMLLTIFLTMCFNNTLMINKEYNYVKENSKLISSYNSNNLPITSGLIIAFNREGKIAKVEDVDNIKSSFVQLTKDSILQVYKVYYAEPRIGRRELRDYILRNGINFK